MKKFVDLNESKNYMFKTIQNKYEKSRQNFLKFL